MSNAELFPRAPRRVGVATKLRTSVTVAGIWAVLFAGGGGSTRGIVEAGQQVDVAINHNPTALAVHAANHPSTEHLVTDVWDVSPTEASGGRPVFGLWASPDCRDFSVAKGGKPRSKKIRSLAWVVTRWAREVAPTLLLIENVREFSGWGPLLANGKRDPRRIGKTFRAWCAKLRSYGYVVEHRALNAADYGAPTNRRRLYVVARRDGLPIVWPAVTHGKGLLPYKTAADCIDWSLPCPSIFLTKAEAKAQGLNVKRPLSDKTLWRIAQGLRRFVFENQRPFIVKVNHGKMEPRHESIDEPLSTVTARQRGHALVMPVLQQSGYGEREGQRARNLQIELPLGTIVAGGAKHALVSAFMCKHYGDPLRQGGGGVVIGQELTDPLGTVTTRDHHSLQTITLSEPEERPGYRVRQVRSFLSVYYGSDGTGGQQLMEPMRTVTAKARLGLVTVEGTDYQVVDIGFRMLEPHELLAAQCGEYACDFDLSAAKTKAEQIDLIGNMVVPHVAKALVAANTYTDRAVAA